MINRIFSFFLVFGLFVSSLSVATVAAAPSSHIYVNGRISHISNSSITVAGVQCHLAKKVRVLVRDKRNNSFYEYPSTTSSVSTGSVATVRIDGNVVDEIIIERWTR